MNRVLKFLREVKVEFNNISWPKKDALLKLTIVVISISVVTSLILGGFDYLFTASFGLIGELKASQTRQQQLQQQPVEISGFPTIVETPAASPTASKVVPTIKK